MSLIESMFSGMRMLASDVSGTAGAYDDFWYEPMGGRNSAAGIRVSPETSKKLGVVIACASSRGKTIAMLPFKVRRDLRGGGSKVIANHPVWRLIAKRPNSFQTPYDFRLMLNAHVDLRGNGYAEKVGNVQGYPEQLLPMHPDRVRVEVAKSGRLLYIYNDPLLNKERRLVQEEVFHLRDWSDNGYTGQSRVTMALDPFGVALARQDYMARWLKNDARTGMVFAGGDFRTPEAEERWIEQMRAGGTGANRGRPMWTPKGMTVSQMGVTPVDAQLIEGKKASDQEICSIMGEYPHVIGIDAGKAATYASVEQFNIMRAQNVVHPMVIMWEQAVQRDLLLDDAEYSHLSMAALMRGDNATRFAGYATAIEHGWLSPDDVRELEDLNPIADGAGKVYWRSANLLPLKQLEAPAKVNSATAGGDPEDDDAPEDGAGGDSDPKAMSPAKRAQFELMASAQAERCVRRETSEVRKMIDHRASGSEVAEFYAKHAAWIAEVFRLNAKTTLEVRSACDDRGQQLAMHLADEDDEFLAAAQVWVEQIAATEPRKLAKLAVEGI